MAVTNLYKAANSPVHSSSNIFSLRGIFTCCYGKGAQNHNGLREDDAEHPLAENESDDSDEEVRESFEKLKRGESFRGHDSVDLEHGQPASSGVVNTTLSGSLEEGRFSQASYKGSVAKSIQGSVLESKGSRSLGRYDESIGEGGVSLKDEEASDSSEHLSDESSVTQYSEEYGDAPQGLTNLTDVSDEDDNQVRPSGRIPTLGSLSIAVSYEAKKAKLKVRVREAKDIPDPSKGGATSYQLHLVLLPERRQRHKTKLRSAARLTFEETFLFSRVSPSTIVEHALRVRLYGCERMRRERLVAETVVALSTFGLQSDEKFFDIPLEPRTKLKSRKRTGADPGSDSDSGLSIQGAIPHGNNLPEVLLGLSYNGTTGRLTVEVIKGSSFRLAGLSRPPDSYVKMNLISSNGQEISRSKTSVRRNDPNPLFKETFMFQMAMFQLVDLTLMIFVYHKKNITRKESIGWFSLGHNSSGEEEITHWRDMREALGERVVRWHLLLEPS